MTTKVRWAEEHKWLTAFTLGALTSCAALLWWGVTVTWSVDLKGRFEIIISALSAIATTAAAYIALHLGRQGKLVADKQAYEMATLYAAGLAETLSTAVKELDEYCVICSFSFNETPVEANPFRDSPGVLYEQDVAVDELFAHLESSIFATSPDIIAKLVPLGNHCAHRLYAGCTALSALRSEMASFRQSGGQWQYMSSRRRRSQFLTWIDQVNLALRSLKVAAEHCQKAAKAGAPVPSLEEMYG